jgi:hypothetical protein
MSRWQTLYSTRSPIPSRPSPPTAPTIRIRSARWLVSVIQTQPSLCRRGLALWQAPQLGTAPTQRDRHLRMIAERARESEHGKGWVLGVSSVGALVIGLNGLAGGWRHPISYTPDPRDFRVAEKSLEFGLS